MEDRVKVKEKVLEDKKKTHHLLDPEFPSPAMQISSIVPVWAQA